MSALDTIRSMEAKDFEKLAYRIARELGFEVKGAKVTDARVELDSYLKLATGETLHYIFILSRQEIDRDFLEDALEKVNNPFLKILVMSAGDVEDDAIQYAESKGIELSQWDEFLQFMEKYGILREIEKTEEKDTAFLPSLGEVQSMEAWAKNFMEEGNYRKAMEYIEDGLKIKDSYLPLIRLKADILRKMGRDREAEDGYRRAIAIEETDAASWVALAGLLEARGDSEGALVSLDRLTNLLPDNYRAWMEKGDLLYRIGKYDEALLCFNRASQINPQGKEAWNNRGLVLKHTGKFEEAVDSFNRSLAIDPVFWDALINKALLFHERSMYPQAIDTYAYMLRIRDDPAIFCQRGMAYSDWGMKAEAVSDMKKALQLDPELTSCAEELKKLGGFEEPVEAVAEPEAPPEMESETASALAAFVDAVKTDENIEEPSEEETGAEIEELTPEPETEEPVEDAAEPETEEAPEEKEDEKPDVLSGISSLSQLMTRGELYFKLGMLEEALQCFEKLVEAKPRSHEMLNSYASILYLLDRKEESLDAERRAVELNPDFEKARMGLIQIQIDFGHMPRALDMMNSILRKKRSASLWIRRGKLLENMGREGASIQSYEKAIEIFGPMIRVWNAVGINYHKIGEDEDALESFEDGIGSDERDPVLWSNYGAVQYLSGNEEDAGESFERGLSEDAGSAPLHNNIGVILANKGDRAGAREKFTISLEKEESATYAYNNSKYI